MSNFFAPAEACNRRSVDINDGDGGGHLGARCRLHGDQVGAQQNDRIFRRAVQNLHFQIIEVSGRGPVSTHTREMKHVKRWRNCQRRTSIGLNRLWCVC